MMFLRDPWIERTSKEQLQGRRRGGSVHAQVIEILGLRGDGGVEVCVSDSRHFILGVLSHGSVVEFHKEIDCEIRDIKGCCISANVFHYDFCYERRKFVMYVDEFTYYGGEGDTYGEPMDINSTSYLRTLIRSPLYLPVVPEELFIHRSSVQSVDVDIEQDLCGKSCRSCNGVRSIEHPDKATGRSGTCVSEDMCAGNSWCGLDIMSFGYNPGEEDREQIDGIGFDNEES